MFLFLSLSGNIVLVNRRGNANPYLKITRGHCSQQKGDTPFFPLILSHNFFPLLNVWFLATQTEEPSEISSLSTFTESNLASPVQVQPIQIDLEG